MFATRGLESSPKQEFIAMDGITSFLVCFSNFFILGAKLKYIT